MKSGCRALLLSLLVAAVTVVAEPPRTLLVLGDSLSAEHGLDRGQGWVALLAARVAARGWRVVNASISGETTAGGRERLPALLASGKPRLVVIELGGNDGLRGLDLERTRDNLAQMARAARGSGASVLVLGMRLPPNYGQRYTERFAAIYREVAGSEDAVLVPFLLAGVGGRMELMQPDGIHPRAVAQPALLENVWPYLEPLL